MVVIKKDDIPYRNFIDTRKKFKFKPLNKKKINSFPKIVAFGKWYAIKHYWMGFFNNNKYDEINEQNEYKLNKKYNLYELKFKQKSLTNLKNVDFDKILVLKTKKDMIAFSKKYRDTNIDLESYGNMVNINWNKVVKNFGGIEVTVYPVSNYIRRHPDTSWYAMWDVPSGCIWNNKIIKEINKIV